MAEAYLDKKIASITKKIHQYTRLLKSLKIVKQELYGDKINSDDSNDYVNYIDSKNKKYLPNRESNIVDHITALNEIQEHTSKSEINTNSNETSLLNIMNELEKESASLRNHIEEKRKQMHEIELQSKQKLSQTNNSTNEKPLVNEELKESPKEEFQEKTTEILQEEPIKETVKPETTDKEDGKYIPINPLLRYTKTKQNYILKRLFDIAKTNINKSYTPTDNETNLNKTAKINEEASRLFDLWSHAELNGNPMFIVPNYI